MIVMISNHSLDECEKELGLSCEQIMTPESRHNAYRPEGHFCIDNGAFKKFVADSFISLLKREENRRDLCRFVAVPDVVGCARRTLECFRHWQPRLAKWPVAFVCQDGQENLEIPWDNCAAVFIGGSTDWKMGPHAAAIVKASKVIGKWCHVGRINTPGRLEYFEDLGADSCDGTGLSRYSHMRLEIHKNATEPKLL